jgi:hypothetical protein
VSPRHSCLPGLLARAEDLMSATMPAGMDAAGRALWYAGQLDTATDLLTRALAALANAEQR